MAIKASAILTVAALAALSAAGAAYAHRSYAAFDRTKTVTVTGVAEQVEWTNPHIWVFVMAPGPDGKVSRWAVEGDGPGGMTRAGWARSAAKPGDKITLTINPMITGQLGGHYVAAVLPNNVTINRR